ncbi:hypothetical protein LTS09_002749 [Friedmanniomyces endolithicus]|nr:hypothetical protein LTS09_002749 [Friedmanniomyces endolithicus]
MAEYKLLTSAARKTSSSHSIQVTDKIHKMLSITKLAALAVVLTSSLASAWTFDIAFTRYRDSECTQPYHTDHMKANKCYNGGNSLIEMPVNSFLYDHRRHLTGDNRIGCTVSVYKKLDCQGEGYSMGDAASTFKQCGTFPADGDEMTGYNSISVTCDGKKPDHGSKKLGGWHTD